VGSKPAITAGREPSSSGMLGCVGSNLTYPSTLTVRRDTSSYTLHSVLLRMLESSNICALENFSMLRSGLKILIITYYFNFYANENYTRLCVMQKAEDFVYVCVSVHTRDSLGFSHVIKQT
jgi:hypothetical protein